MPDPRPHPNRAFDPSRQPRYENYSDGYQIGRSLRSVVAPSLSGYVYQHGPPGSHHGRWSREQHRAAFYGSQGERVAVDISSDIESPVHLDDVGLPITRQSPGYH